MNVSKIPEIIIHLNNPMSRNATVLKANDTRMDDYIYLGCCGGQNRGIQKSGVGANFNAIA